MQCDDKSTSANQQRRQSNAPLEVNSKSSGFNAKTLCANHEEGDTRIVLHATDAIDRGQKRVEVHCNTVGIQLVSYFLFTTTVPVLKCG